MLTASNIHYELSDRRAVGRRPIDRSDDRRRRDAGARRPTIVQQASAVDLHGHVSHFLPPRAFEAVRAGMVGARVERGMAADARNRRLHGGSDRVSSLERRRNAKARGMGGVGPGSTRFDARLK